MTDGQLKAVYGVQQTGGVCPSELAPWRTDDVPCVDWTTRRLRITRLRLLSDPGFPLWDVSYCYGTVDGKPVRVQLPFDQLPKRGMLRAIIDHGKREGVYVRGTGMLDNISTLQ